MVFFLQDFVECLGMPHHVVLHYLRVYLRRRHVAVPQHLADCLDGDVVGQTDGRGEGVAGNVEYTWQSKRQRTGKD